jgi:hypothetical protein
MTDASAPAARIPGIDFVRGMALLGITFVNVQMFAAPFERMLRPALPEGVSSLGAGFWRYSYAGTLPLGAISVGVVANQVRDLAGRAVVAGVLGSFTRVDGRPAVTAVSIDAFGRFLTITFSNPTNIQSLITSGQIATAVQLTARQGSVDVPVTLAASRFSWNPATRRLTVDLRTDPAASFSRSILPTPPNLFRLSLSTMLINNGIDNPLLDDDGVGDGFRRSIFSWTPPKYFIREAE